MQRTRAFLSILLIATAGHAMAQELQTPELRDAEGRLSHMIETAGRLSKCDFPASMNLSARMEKDLSMAYTQAIRVGYKPRPTGEDDLKPRIQHFASMQVAHPENCYDNLDFLAIIEKNLNR